MRNSSKTFADLILWQKAHNFVLSTYSLTNQYPKDERYALSSQFRRAAVSIPANIAEGFRRRGKADKARFFNIAQGSLEECRYYLILSNDLNYGNTSRLSIELEEVSKLLDSYYNKIISSIP